MIPRLFLQFLLIIFLLSSGRLQSAVIFTQSNGNWNINSTWSCNCIPSAADDVTLNHNVTIQNGSPVTVSSITINPASTLDVQDGLTYSGVLTVNGTILFNTLSGTMSFNEIIINSSGTWTTMTTINPMISGNFTNNGSFSSGSGTYTFTSSNGTGIIGGANSISIYVLSFNSGAQYTNNGTIYVNNLSGAGALTQGNNSYLRISGIASLMTLNAGTNPNVVEYNGSAQTIRTASYWDLLLNGTTATLGGATTIVSDLKIYNGTLNTGTFQITTNPGDSMLMKANTFFNAGSTGSSQTVDFPFFNAYQLDNASTVSYQGNYNQTVLASYGNLSYGNLILTTGAASVVKSLTGILPSPFTLTVNGNLSLPSSKLNFNISDNTVNVGGDLQGIGMIQMTSGKINVKGNFSNTGGFIAGTGTVNYNGSANQNIRTVSYWNLIVSGTSIKTLLGNTTVNGNLMINGSAQFDVSASNFTLTLNGSNMITNTTAADPFIERNGTVLFRDNDGLTDTIGGNDTITFFKLKVNQLLASGIVFTAPVYVIDSFMPVNGVIKTSPGSELMFAPSALSSAGNDSSFVDGPAVKLGAAAFIFPSGNGNKWAPLGISGMSGDDNTRFTAQYFNNGFGSYTAMFMNHVSQLEYWTLNRSGTVTTANVTLYWKNQNESQINDYPNITVARFNGTNWVDEGRSAMDSANPGLVTSFPVSNFSPFTFGSYAGGGSNPFILFNTITVDSLSDTAFCPGATVLIYYTASGTFSNGNIFTAELSDASGSFLVPSVLGTVTGMTSGVITGAIPITTIAGTGYRIRVVSSLPLITGTDNGYDLAIGVTTADAGTDAIVCKGDPFNLSGSIGGGATSSAWTTSGSGTFNDSSLLNAVYTPSAGDFSTGSIKLILTTNDADGGGPCQPGRDTMILAIAPLPSLSTSATFDYDTCNGTATVKSSGGTPPYNYSWDDPSFSINDTVAGLCGGVYHVTVTDNNSCTSTDSANVITAIVSFTADTNGGCVPVTVNFTNTSNLGVSGVAYLWYFVSGAVADGPHFIYDTSYTFLAGGQKTIWLFAIDTGMNVLGSDSMNINFSGSSGYFVMTDDTVCPGDNIIFVDDANISSYYNWNFGDGFYQDGTNNLASHSWFSPGIYNVSLAINTVCGPDTVIQPVVVSNTSTGIGAIQAGPQPVCPGDNLAIASFGSSGNFVWDFGDGITGYSGVPYTVHAYANTGNYIINMTATDGCGSVMSASDTIAVSGGVPISGNFELSANPNPVCPGDMVKLKFEEGENFSSYLWDFGDGVTQAGSATVYHSYPLTGNYTVSVTVTNGCGSSTVVTVPVTVQTGVTASAGEYSYGAIPTSACPGDSVVFYIDGITGGGYVWDFGDGVSDSNYIHKDSSAIIWHAYAVTGVYQAVLTITNGCGNNVSELMTVWVSDTFPVVSSWWGEGFSWEGRNNGPSQACKNVNFFAFGGSTFKWSFGDGDSVQTSSMQVNHIYTAAGTYTVSLDVTNSCGNSKQYFSNIVITGACIPPVISDTSSPPLCNGGNEGWILVSASGGMQPYTFQWSTGQSSVDSLQSVIDSLVAGNYFLTLTDAAGTALNDTIILTQPPAFTFATSSNDVSCTDTCDGSVSVTAAGGTPPYSYAWSNGAGTPSLTALCTGIYTVTVYDSLACSQIQSFTVAGVPGFYADLTGIPDTNWISPSTQREGLCCTATTPDLCVHFMIISDSLADRFFLNINSGTIPSGSNYYMMDCDPASTTLLGDTLCLTAGGLHNFTYCKPGTNSNDYIIGTRKKPAVNAGVDLSVCPGTDTIPLNGSGSGASSYLWLSSGSGTFYPGASVLNTSYIPSSFDISSGSVQLALAGAGTCNNVYDTMFIQFTSPLVLSSASSPECSPNSGAASVSVSGGAPPYSYVWNNGNTLSLASALASGTYAVTVTDVAGCTDTAFATVASSAFFTAEIKSYINPSCNGGNNGTATAMAAKSPAQSFIVSPNIAIPDTGCFSGAGAVSAITVNGYSDPVSASAISVKVNITHTFDGDLQLFLTAPTGQTLMLSTSNGSLGDNYTNTVFTDAALTNIVSGTPPFTGQFKPEGGLTSACSVVPTITSFGAIGGGNFNPNGNWTLKVFDNMAIDTGYVSNWSLSLPPVSETTGNYSYAWSPSAGGQTTSTATALASGNYDVTVTNALGCYDTAKALLTAPPVLSTATSLSKCSGDSAFLQNSWRKNPGNYTDTLVSMNGCDSIVTTALSFNTPPVANAGPDGSSCPGGLYGLSGSVSGAANTIQWITSGTGAFSNAFIASPTYNPSSSDISGGNVLLTLTVDDGIAACPADSDAMVLTFFSKPAVSVAKTDATCIAPCGGTFNATASGGSSPYTYFWNNGLGTGASKNNVCPGIYTVLVTDANNCKDSARKTVSEPVSLISAITGYAGASCFGKQDGFITAGIVSAGQQTFSATVNDSIPDNGCTSGLGAVNSIVVSGYPGAIPANKISVLVNLTHTYDWDVTMYLEAPNGDILKLSAYNGSSGDNYTNTVFTDTAFAGIATGVAPFTGTFKPQGGMAGSCTNSPTVNSFSELGGGTINPNGTWKLKVYDVLGVFTGTLNNWSLYFPAAVYGTSPFSYQWDDANSQTTSAAIGLPAGNYQVIITDANGCSDSSAATLNQPSFKGDSVSIAICAGDSVFLQGNYQTAGGIYYDTIPAGGCDSVIVTTLAVNQPDVLSITSSNASCGQNNGSASVSPSGGTPPYTFAWSDSLAQTGSVATGLGTGIYSVTVSDGSACSASQSVTVSGTPALALSVSSINSTCGNADGSASVSVTGGSGSYTYQWDAGAGNQTVSTATGLAAGTYSVTVTDSSGCADAINASVSDLGGPSLTISSTNILCNGGFADSAYAAASGGTPPYGYLWSTSDTTKTITGLVAGIYSVTVNDYNNCISSQSVSITEPPAISLSATTTNSTCGNADGSASVTASGGSGTFTYSWNTIPVQTNAAATGLAAGTYSVDVTDSSGCTATTNASVSDTTGPLLSLFSSAVSCNGGADGTASVTASGGSPPYTFLWDTIAGGQSSSVATGLSAGTYSVTVTDGSGCKSSDIITVAEPASLYKNISVTDATCGNSDGAASVSVTGGTPPYSFLWNDAMAQTDSSATGLAPGIYSVTVFDSNGCSDSTTATVIETGCCVLTTSVTIVTNNLCNGDTAGSAKVTVASGTPPFTYSWSSPDGNSTDSVIGGLLAGNYQVTVTDQYGCTDTLSFTITQPPGITFTIDSIKNVTCYGGNNGGIYITVSGGALPYSAMAWFRVIPYEPVSISEDLSNMIAGWYAFGVIDANGCRDSLYIGTTITQPLPLVNSITATSVPCSNVCTASATIVLNSANPYISYLWDDGQTTQSATGLCMGNHYVTVTDTSGCVESDTADIISSGIPKPVFAASSVNYCQGDKIDSLKTQPQAGGVILWYLSPPPPATAVDTGNAYLPSPATGDNNYYVTEWKSPCESEPAVTTVTLLELPLADAGNDAVVCHGEKTHLLASGGISYRWKPSAGLNDSTISGPSASPADTTMYFVTVTGSNGCTAMDSVTVFVDFSGNCWHVYNMFSPNNDGKNDEWIIDGIVRFPENKVTLFNRYEDKVRMLTGYDNVNVVWKGENSSGEPLPAGAYFYVIDTGENKFSGWVQVIR